MQWTVNLVLAGLQMTHCRVYIDGVNVVGRNFVEHVYNLCEVLKQMGLKLKPSKTVSSSPRPNALRPLDVKSPPK